MSHLCDKSQHSASVAQTVTAEKNSPLGRGKQSACPTLSDGTNCGQKPAPTQNGGEMKEKRITVRFTDEQIKTINEKAALAQMTPSAYIRAAAMRHKVIVVDGLREMVHEVRGIGRNLNQLTILANEGRFTSPDLSGMVEKLDKIYGQLYILTDQERR